MTLLHVFYGDDNDDEKRRRRHHRGARCGARHLPTCNTFQLKVPRKENERASGVKVSSARTPRRPNDDTVRAERSELRSREVKASSARTSNERAALRNDVSSTVL